MRTIEYYKQNPVIDVCDNIVIVRDLNHRFVASSPQLSTYSGITPLKLVGLSDRDMPWRDHTKDIISHELATLCGECKTEIHKINQIIFVAHKSIVYKEIGLSAGTITTAMAISQHVITSLTQRQDLTAYSGEELTDREKRMLYFLTNGFRRSRIISKLEISISTYEYHIRKLKKKFSVTTPQELIIRGIQFDMHILGNKSHLLTE